MNRDELINKQTKITTKFVIMIPEIRKELNMSQTEFGNKVGLSRQTISAIERGQVPLAWDTFLAMGVIIMANNKDLIRNEEYFETVKELCM